MKIYTVHNNKSNKKMANKSVIQVLGFNSVQEFFIYIERYFRINRNRASYLANSVFLLCCLRNCAFILLFVRA